jgi:hypothetical protein
MRVRRFARPALSFRSGLGESTLSLSAQEKAEPAAMIAWRRPPFQVGLSSSQRETWNGFASAARSVPYAPQND